MKVVGLIFFLISVYYLFNFFYFGRVGAFFGFVILMVAHVILTTLISERPQRLWFKAKRFGYGWTPVTWEGWVVTVVGTTLLIGIGYCADALSHSVSDTLLTAVPYLSLVLAAMIAVGVKTGEPAKWKWGN